MYSYLGRDIADGYSFLSLSLSSFLFLSLSPFLYPLHVHLSLHLFQLRPTSITWSLFTLFYGLYFALSN